MSITVYTKPACVQCNATYKALDKQGIAYDKVDISRWDTCRLPSWWPETSTGRASGPTGSRRSPVPC